MMCRFDLDAFDRKPYVVALRTRKNLGAIHRLLTELHGRNKLLAGDTFTASQLLATISPEDIDRLWDRDPEARDDSGPAKAMGDILGGHGLRLRRQCARGKFIMPKKLPVVVGDSVTADAIY